MFADVDAGNAQAKRDARKRDLENIGDITTVAEGEHNIHTRDHDWTPNKEDG